MFNLTCFITTGRLFGVGLNDSVLDVMNIFGKPVHIYDEIEHSTIYNYGNVEFIFGRQGVASLEVKLYEDANIINVSGVEFFNEIGFNEFSSLLSSLSINHRKGKASHHDFVVFFNENGRASFKNDMLMTISVINPGEIY